MAGSSLIDTRHENHASDCALRKVHPGLQLSETLASRGSHAGQGPTDLPQSAHRLMCDGVEGGPAQTLLLLPFLSALLALEVNEELLEGRQPRGGAEAVAGGGDGHLR